MRLKNLDLKTLQLFALIHKHRNLSRAADALDLTQPAVSQALGRLRLHFGDPLFVRVGGAMVPTIAADQIAHLVDGAMAQLEATLAFRPGFDPPKDERMFRIAMTDVGQIVILPRLLNALSDIAPNVRVDASSITTLTVKELQEGSIDIAMGFTPDMEGRFITQAVFNESFSCLVKSAHPRVGKELTAERYEAESHVIVKTFGTGHLIIGKALLEQGITRKVGVQIPNFISLATIVGSTDLVATLPSRAAHVLSLQSNVRVVPLPVPIPGYPVRQHWHERMQKDPGHIWLRGVIAELFREELRPARTR